MFRSTRIALALVPLAAALACSRTPTTEQDPTVAITQPNDGQVLTGADDEDPTTPGMQFTVKAHVTNVTAQATAVLLIDGSEVAGTQQNLAAGAQDIGFAKATLPAGSHSVGVRVDDAATSKSALALVNVTVQSSAQCTFTKPTATLGVNDDEDPSTPQMESQVVVSCPGIAAGTAASLQVAVVLGSHRQELAPLSGTADANGDVVFDKTPLGEGQNALLFSAGSGAFQAQETVTVDTGACPVVLGEPGEQIFNVAGGAPTDPADTRPATADADPNTPGIQESFTAYTDVSVCPQGTAATILFNGTAAGTAVVDSSGKASFTNVTLPDGDPVAEQVQLSATPKQGNSQPNLYGVDSVVPELSISQPSSATLTSADDLDPATPGLQTKIGIHEVGGIDSATQVSVVDNGAASALIPATSGLSFDASGDYVFPQQVTLPSGTNALVATATRRLGNVGTASFTTDVTEQTDGGLPDAGFDGGGILPASIELTAPSAGLINASIDHGDHATYAAFRAAALFATTPPAGTRVRICSTAPVDPDAGIVCAGIAGAFEVPGTLVSATSASVDYSNPLPHFAQGDQNVYAQAMLGSQSIASPAVHITVDTFPPAVQTINVVEDADANGILNASESTAGTPIHVHVTFKNVEQGDSAQIVESGAQVATASVDATGAADFALNSVADGAHTYKVLVTDASGNPNENPSAAVPYTDPNDTLNLGVHRVPPSISVIAPGFTVCNSTRDLDSSTQDCDIDFAVLVGSTGTHVTFSGDNGDTFDSTTAVPDANGNAGTQAHLPQGNTTLSATVIDGFGNSSTTSVALLVDTIAPTISITSPSANQTFNSQSVPITVQTSGAKQGQIVSVTSSLGSGTVGSAPVDASGNASFNVRLPTGTQTLSATVSDVAGNTSVPATVSITVEIVGCEIDFNNAASVILNQASGATMNITGKTPTPGCGGQTISFYAATPPGSTRTLISSTTTAADGSFSLQYTFPDQAQTELIAEMTYNQTNDASFVASVDTIPPQITVTAPVADSSSHIYVVAASGNRNVANGVAGYIADADGSASGAQMNLNLSVTNGGDAFGSGSGTLTVTQNGVTKYTQTISSDGTVNVSQLLQLDEGTGNFVISVTDTANNTTTITDAMRVKSTRPPAPTMVTSDPGNGVYTKIVNHRHADWDAVFTAPSDPNALSMTYDFGYSNSLLLGGQAYSETAFYTSGVTTHSTGTMPAAGTNTTIHVTKVPPFNVYDIVVRAVDDVGNTSVFPTTITTLDTTWPSVTVAYPGASASGAAFGERIETGDIDGDGNIDYAIGAAESDNSGSIYIYYGGALPAQRTQAFHGSGASSYFGYSFSLGDVNGDGHADLVTYNAGVVDIYLAPTNGGQLPTTPSVTISGSATAFTLRVVGDITGDGIPDLVIADPYASPNGVVYIFEGRTTWPSTLTLSNADFKITAQDSGAKLGNVSGKGAISVPDCDGDGIRDLVIPADAINKAYLIGSSTLKSKTTSVTTADALAVFSSTASRAGDYYGYSLFSTDLTGDGSADLLIGGFESQGKVFEYDFASGSLQPNPTGTPIVSGGTDFGPAMAAGDLNGDGAVDLAIGQPTLNATGVWLYFASGPGKISLASAQSGLPGTGSYGADISIADLNNSGAPDLLVGAFNQGNGNVQIFY